MRKLAQLEIRVRRKNSFVTDLKNMSKNRRKKKEPKFFNTRLEKDPSLRFASFYVCLALVAITWFVFGQTLRHDFVDFDDHIYVYQNPVINRGLSLAGVLGAFTHRHAGNWHP